MSVAVVLPAGSYRVSDTGVALLQQLLLLLPAQDIFNSVLKSLLKSFSVLTTNITLIVIVIYHFYRVHYFSELYCL